MQIVPSSFRQTARYIARHHRHHKPPRGGKVFIAAREGGVIVGVAVIGRPSARAFDQARVAEITRTCTDGASNANSLLYGACARITKAMGYERVITYNEDGESGASLKAAGFVKVADLEPRSNWAEASIALRHLRDVGGRGHVRRARWEIVFTGNVAPREALIDPVDGSDEEGQQLLLGYQEAV